MRVGYTGSGQGRAASDEIATLTPSAVFFIDQGVFCERHGAPKMIKGNRFMSPSAGEKDQWKKPSLSSAEGIF